MVVPRGLQGLWLYVLYSYYVQLQWAGLLYVEGQRLSHWNFLILCFFSKSLDLDFQRCTTALTKLYVNGIGHVGHVSKKAVQYRFYMSFRNLSILQNMPLALSDAVQCHPWLPDHVRPCCWALSHFCIKNENPAGVENEKTLSQRKCFTDLSSFNEWNVRGVMVFLCRSH